MKALVFNPVAGLRWFNTYFQASRKFQPLSLSSAHDSRLAFHRRTALPADRLEEAAYFIRTLLEERRLRRESMTDATSGSLAGEEGQALESALAKCSTVDENAW